MHIKIYQIDLSKDENGIAFQSLDEVGANCVNAAIYNTVFNGNICADDLEDVFRIFNIDKPDDYNGRSMSVSDVIEVVESDTVNSGCYYCNHIGFTQIHFDADMCADLNDEMITVIMCEPGNNAYVTQIGTNLKSLQDAVDGYVEAYYPFDDDVCIVCNEEGKFNGMMPCRGICDENGEILDIVFGKFFICDCSGEHFGSLSDDKVNKYLAKFHKPEHFFREDGVINSVKYDPIEENREV